MADKHGWFVVQRRGSKQPTVGRFSAGPEVGDTVAAGPFKSRIAAEYEADKLAGRGEEGELAVRWWPL